MSTPPIDELYGDIIEQPLPPMTLRIGVAGHRELPSASLDHLRQHLKGIYEDIYKIIRQLANTTEAQTFYAETFPKLRLISSLAEGADRLCIEPELIPFDHQLACILPFEREAYAEDFTADHSVIDSQKGTVEDYKALLKRAGLDSPQAAIIELDGKLAQREQAYRDCAQLLSEHCDILIAVFDGDMSQSQGTSDTVKRAMHQGVPIIHLSTSDLSCSLFPSNRFGQSAEAFAYDEQILTQELRRLLLFEDILQDRQSGKDRRADIFARFKRYQGGDHLDYRPEISSDFANQGPIALKTPYLNHAAQAFNRGKAWVAKSIATTQPITEPSSVHNTATSTHHFYAAYLRADRLANFYANIHRSTFLLIYCCGALALITAALALLFKSAGIVGLNLALVLIELALLGCIYWLYHQDHHHQYHGRWLEYRYLAEYLRPMVYLAPLGKNYPLTRIRDTREYLGRELLGHNSPGRSWLYIHTETLIRAIGFNHFRLDNHYKKAIKQQASECWLDRQINYHNHNAKVMQFVGKRLEHWSFQLFIGTVAVVGIKLLIILLELLFGIHSPKLISSLITLATAVLPILASLFFAIGNHAEFDISAQRSLSMRAFLSTQRDSIAALEDAKAMELSQHLQTVADMTIEESTEWLEIYEVKEAEPA